MAKTAFNEKEVIFARKLLLNLRNKLVKSYIWILGFSESKREICWKF